MTADPHTRDRHPGPPGAVLRYALGWLGAGALVAALVLVARPHGSTPDLPPVHQIQLARAARSAGCDLHRGSAAQRLGVPTPRGTGRAAAPGAYDRPIAPAAVAAALRRGIVVILYRRGVSQSVLDRLTAVQSVVPTGTILAPSAAAMPFDVAVSAWRRLMRCRRFGTSTIDALRLFRGRFLGSGPGG